MKRFLVIVFLTGAIGVSCQKQQSEEERRAEVERQVQERVAAERQQQQAQDLAQREADLNAREQALNSQQQPSATATPAAQTEVRREAATQAQPTGNSYGMFYTRLEPYGDWIETDDYGYVYRPRAAENNRWRPYTDGRWVYTDAGWTWVSEEPFGWATYHYGRWTRIRGLGWVWVPGTQWAPAWVSWRSGGQYVGWAPLPPEAHFDAGSGIHNWSDNYYDIGPDQYVFVPTVEIGEQRIERAIVPEQQNVTIINQTTNVTNITYNNTVVVNQGPNYDQLRAQSRAPIPRLRLEREATVPAQNAHAEVRGDVVAIPAPSIAPQPQERPRAVKQTINRPAVDRGWEAVGNRPEAEQARAKMKAEATPPPNAPSKKFVKPGGNASPAQSAAANPSIAATAAPLRTPTGQSPRTSPAAPRMTPQRSIAAPPSATMTPRTTFTPQTTATPVAPVATPSAFERPAGAPSATPVQPTATPFASERPSARPSFTPLGKAFAPSSRTAAPAPPNASRPPANSTPEQSAAPERTFSPRAPARPAQSPSTPPSTPGSMPAATSNGASPTPAQSSPPAAKQGQRDNRHERGEHSRQPPQTSASPTPTP